MYNKEENQPTVLPKRFSSVGNRFSGDEETKENGTSKQRQHLCIGLQ